MGGSKATIPLLVLALAFGVTLALYLWPALGPQVAGIASAPPSAAPSGVGQMSGGSPSTAPSPPAPPAPTPAAPPAPPAPVIPPSPRTATSVPPQFDVVRVEPNGEAVIAGKGAPNAKMEALASGKVVGEAMADGSGQFVILPPPFPPGDYDLTLRQTVEGNAAESTQSVAVSVPAKGGEVVVALAEPGKPTRLLGGPPKAQAPETQAPETQAPQTPAPAPPTPNADVANAPPDAVTPEAPPPMPHPAAKPALAIRSVELENGNGFFVTGTAAAGTRLQIYLNASHLADVVAGPDGQWSLTIKQGLTPGHYAVRADAGGADVTGAGGAVAARAEVPFDVPVAMAQATTPAPKMDSPAPVPAMPPAAPPLPRPDIAAAVPQASQTTKAPSPAASSPATPSTPVPTESIPPAPAAANAVIEQVETARVVRGDNLWNISRARLGHGRRFTQIYDANASQIRDPRLIYPGQVFVMPKK